MKSLFLGPFSLLTQYCHTPPFPPPLRLYLALSTCTIENSEISTSSPGLLLASRLYIQLWIRIHPTLFLRSLTRFQTVFFPSLPLPSSLIHPPAEFFQCLLLLTASCLLLFCLQLPVLLQSLAVTWPASLLLVLNSQRRSGNPPDAFPGTSDLPGW